MKATNKQEFFELLGYELNRIGIDDTTEIFADFEEHFSDGFIRGIPENEIAENLGDIKEIARSYLNIESSRLNSIMAREVERKRVSLTKPGRSVPADLSLLKDENSQNLQDILNSDNIRSYTPEHLSGEIYPEAPTSTPAGGAGASQGAASASASGTGSNSQGAGAAAANNQTVAGAFSEAGRAAVDAAKVAGHAIADAFTQSNVKSKMSEAGKTAANAVKTAGKSAADAINKARSEHEQKHGKAKSGNSQSASGATSQASEVYPGAAGASGSTIAASAGVTGASGSTTGKSKKSGKKRKPFSRISDFKGMKTNVNSEKLAVAIVLDVFLWSWLLPVIAGMLIAMFFGGLRVIFAQGFGAFADYGYYYISKLFLFTGFCSLGAIICMFAVLFIKLFLKLVNYIIVLHYKAIFNV